MATQTNQDDQTKLVRCLVSVVLGISDLHQRQTLEELRLCNDKIVKIQKYLKGMFFVAFASWQNSLSLCRMRDECNTTGSPNHNIKKVWFF